SDNAHQVDVRVIAVTNRDLEQEVQTGRFRADLYHRLSVYPITVPPLRERGRDVSLLSGHFLQQCERKFGLRGLRLSGDAGRWLGSHAWPGNVRELEHAVSRAVVRALGESRSRNRITELSPRLLGAEGLVVPLGNGDAEVGQPGSERPLAEALEQFK